MPPPEDNFDHSPTQSRSHMPKEKTASSSSTRETRSMTGSSKPRFRYINGVAPSHRHMHKVLNALQSGDYLGLSKAQEPQTYKAALASPESAHWIKAIQSEFDSLIKNETWDLTELPSDRKVLTGRWVFKIKYGLNGEIRKYKARWVVHGHKQKYGVDYNETWAGVVKPASFCSLFSIGASRNWHIKQMDVVTAFLYGLLDEVVYVEQPHGFVQGVLVCRLKRALYGLKQAPRVWYSVIRDFLKEKGFTATNSDQSVFISADKQLFLAIYVDDLLLFGANESQINTLKKELSHRFRMTDLGDVSHYLGMEIRRDREKGTLMLLQTAYLKVVLERFGMAECNPSTTPMDSGLPNTIMPSSSDYQAPSKTVLWYSSAVGSLMYAMTMTRPDIAFALSIVSRYCNNPDSTHVAAVTRILRYIKGTLYDGIIFCGDPDAELDLTGFTDADYGSAKEDRKSTSGWLFCLGGGPISWSSKRQSVVALSSCEAEYIALNEAGKEAIWLQRILKELGLINYSPSPTLIYEDNQGTIALAENPEFHRRSKHIDIRYHWIRDAIAQKQITVDYVSTQEQAADGLTKALSVKAFQEFKGMIGMASGAAE